MSTRFRLALRLAAVIADVIDPMFFSLFLPRVLSPCCFTPVLQYLTPYYTCTYPVTASSFLTTPPMFVPTQCIMSILAE